jgi:hypothetical protein
MIEKIHVASINKHIVKDPVLIESMKLLFKIANEAGLKGIKLTNLVLEEREEFNVFLCDRQDGI